MDVLESLKDSIKELEYGKVPVEGFQESLEEYKVGKRSVSALKRAREHGIGMKPGQNVEFVVGKDDAEPLERTRLGFKAENGEYDPDFYRQGLLRTAESILRKDIRERIEGCIRTLYNIVLSKTP